MIFRARVRLRAVLPVRILPIAEHCLSFFKECPP
jgi:hypothetical protein